MFERRTLARQTSHATTRWLGHDGTSCRGWTQPAPAVTTPSCCRAWPKRAVAGIAASEILILDGAGRPCRLTVTGTLERQRMRPEQTRTPAKKPWSRPVSRVLCASRR